MPSALLIHRYFWPDSPPYAVMLREIAVMLVKKGYGVDVLSSQPSYKSVDAANRMPWKERSDDGYGIIRLPVFNDSRGGIFKLINYVAFPILVFGAILVTRRRDLVTVSSAPPVVLAFMVALACRLRGSALIYHCMDLHPEIGRISGEFKSPWIYKALMALEMFTCRSADRIIVLSTDMKNAMGLRNSALNDKIVIINNFALPDSTSDVVVPAEFRKQEGMVRLIFAGNLGRFQRLDRIVSSFITHASDSCLELVFMGEGAMHGALTRMAAGVNNIRFIPHQSVAAAKALIRDADFGVVSLQDEIIFYAFPSKTMTYLECGIPLIFFSANDSELARTLRESRLGYYVSLQNEDSMKGLFEDLKNNKMAGLRREEIIEFYRNNFSQQIFNDKFINVLGNVNATV